MIFNNNDEIEFDISNFLKKKSLESQQHAQSRDLEKQSTLIILAK